MKNKPQAITRAELARRKGVTPGAVTRAAKSFLSGACLGGGRMDLAHPDVIQWLGSSAPAQPTVAHLMLEERAVTLATLAEQTGLPLAELERDRATIAAAVVPAGHVSAAEFAQRAGEPVTTIIVAVQDVLAPAVTRAGRLDLGHEAALEYMAARPFPRGRNGEPKILDIDGEGYLAPACVGELVDADHPVARCFFARVNGRVQTDADFA
jgi:hypothetical protein